MKQILEEKIKDSVNYWFAEHKGGFPGGFNHPDFIVEKPKNEKFGDYTSNVALQYWASLANSSFEGAHTDRFHLHKNEGGFDNVVSFAIEIARDLENKIEEIKKVEVAGPGHLNLYLETSVFTNALRQALREGEHFGDSTLGHGMKVNNEFISANPTGPLHIGNGRGGFYGDSLARLLRKTGYAVINEYYINDAGEQVVKLGHSVLQDEEAVYGGEYISDLQAKIGTEKKDVFTVGQEAAELVMSDYIRPTVEEGMHIHFDTWTSERTLVGSGLIERAIQVLKDQGRTFEEEGALWLRTTEFGDDKDRVLVKSDGSKTYFASDAGHILGYIEAGVDCIIESFGADHHGYTARFEAVARALGFTGEVRFILMQMVKLMKDGEEVRMSKRAGNVVSIDELLEKVGHDVTRFFFLQYSPDTHMTFDLGLAEERSQKNPVYYVQYAHARMASILAKAIESDIVYTDADLSGLVHDKEKSLMREILMFQEFLELAASEYAPHRLPQLAIRLADKFHSYYAECQVIDLENKELSQARLALVAATKQVLGETLRLIGVSAPEKM